MVRWLHSAWRPASSSMKPLHIETRINPRGPYIEVGWSVTEYQAKPWPQGEWEPKVEILVSKCAALFISGRDLMPLPTLIRTMYGSWTDPDQLVQKLAKLYCKLFDVQGLSDFHESAEQANPYEVPVRRADNLPRERMSCVFSAGVQAGCGRLLLATCSVFMAVCWRTDGRPPTLRAVPPW